VGRADELCSSKIKFSSTFELSGVRFCRPVLQHARPLPNGQPNARPVLDSRRKDLLRLRETAASVQHALDPAWFGPFLDLAVIAVVRDRRLVGFFV
jgi:hypothetical protein